SRGTGHRRRAIAAEDQEHHAPCPAPRPKLARLSFWSAPIRLRAAQLKYVSINKTISDCFQRVVAADDGLADGVSRQAIQLVEVHSLTRWPPRRRELEPVDAHLG
ncbi:MAG: hypothetical protein ACI4XG_29230, partial [Bradyrhizobium sp.]